MVFYDDDGRFPSNKNTGYSMGSEIIKKIPEYWVRSIYSLGHRLFSTQVFTWNPEEVLLLFQHDFLGTLTRLSWSVSNAVLAWLILAPFICGMAYFISLRIIKRLKFRTYE
jgi:hypothetical protein